MNIDLSKEISEQLARCRQLAIDAEQDGSSPLSQRATALSTLNSLLREITKTQLETINMRRLQVQEQCLVQLLNEMLSESQIAEFLAEYERRLAVLEQRDQEDE